MECLTVGSAKRIRASVDNELTIHDGGPALPRDLHFPQCPRRSAICKMLCRYTIYRRRPVSAPPLPDGSRKDTRWRTSHILRPTKEMVDRFLDDPNDEAWQTFRRAYLDLLEDRYRESPEQFMSLADLASNQDVFIGCSCPTKKNPDVRRCHTWVALEFMQKRFPDLSIRFP